MLCLDVVGFTSIHMCWGGLEWNLKTKFHPNPLQHMWIEVNLTTSKQDLIELHDKSSIYREPMSLHIYETFVIKIVIDILKFISFRCLNCSTPCFLALLYVF